MAVELTESLLSQAAGWDVMKRARAYLAQGQVFSSFWGPPLLRGVVQVDGMSFRASLVINSAVDMENLCTCRDAREWGKICAHVVGVGLHWLQAQQPVTAQAPVPGTRSPATSPPAPTPRRVPGLQRDPAGEPAELHIILPPNADQALARGRVMLVLEAKWDGGRCPLNALPKGRAFAFSPADTAVLDRLETLAGGETPAVLQIPTKDFASLLPALAGHPNVTLGKATKVAVGKTPLQLPLRATLEANGEITLTLKSKLASLVVFEGWAWQNNSLQPLGPLRPGAPASLPAASEDNRLASKDAGAPSGAGASSSLLRDLLRGPARLSRMEVPRFLSQEWPGLQAGGAVEANFKIEDFTLEPQAPRFLLELRGGLTQLAALLQCAYGARIMTLGVTGADEAVWLPDPDSPTRYSTRNTAAERVALARLQRSGFTGPDAQGKLQLLGQNAVLNFFAREYPRLEREWSVTLEERLERNVGQNIERIAPRFEITPSGVQWFDLGVVFAASDGQTFSPADIQRLLLSGQSHTRLRNGKMAVLDTGAVEELQEVLRDCSPEQHGQRFRISHTQAGFLDATLRQHGDWRVQAPAAWRERAARQSGEAALECPPLGDLDPVLRPYQKHGVGWLRFLRDNAFGGILADEMGLGKTLQTLAFLQYIRSAEQEQGARNPGSQQNAGRGGDGPSPQSAVEDKPSKLPMLVICPTSLVFNWVAEAKKFTPSLRVLALHGPERHAAFAQIPQSDLVVTSYALIRRDAERYRELEFDTIVLDEAQHIKNRQTQNAQAVKSVKARRRVVLTGTPLENSVLDLWSIFDFLMPGYLGTAQDFRERYELPITREKNGPAQTRLARRLRPFVLRRLKKEVAADLPAKLEQVSFCELTPEQRGVYQQLIEASRKEILEAAGDAQGQARSRMMVLSALLRLRQVCCDLRLLKLEGVDPANASGKLDLFGELLEEVIDGGHRVLVFSQFVSMLTLLKERLAQEKIEFCYLDGSTVDRASVVDQFQRNNGIPVFLISLKAGGTGLNLTGADTVIHFDPWWNPAVEDQATDRAHRIGQTKVVTSYKLITRDTVEEKILTLQNRKRELIQSTLGSEEALVGSLSWEEIQELLS